MNSLEVCDCSWRLLAIASIKNSSSSSTISLSSYKDMVFLQNFSLNGLFVISICSQAIGGFDVIVRRIRGAAGEVHFFMKNVYISPPHELAREGTMGMAMGIGNSIALPPQNRSKLNEGISVFFRLCRPTWVDLDEQEASYT
jgi:hypothetical protein